MQENPYVLSADAAKEPPKSLREMIRYLGPGLILSASIVGSGELIATTALGAKAGFVTLWVILVSCLVKVAIQLEFGRHSITTGETTMLALNRLPGPRLGKANWSVWVWLLLMIVKNLQLGGIIGTVALVLLMLFPGASIGWILFFLAVSVSLLVSLGYYRLIEGVSIVMIGLFTLLTLASLLMLQFTDNAITWENLQEGLSFHLPQAALYVAIGAFGITGVGGDEIMVYNYWLIEKGYARHAGPDDGTDAWANRAQGWIRIMYFDALLSMVVYTVVTAVFYLLGAAILHAKGLNPEGAEIVQTLSLLYTETLGESARYVFLLGAFVVLYSTLFAALAAWSRLFGDALSQIGLYDFQNPTHRRRAIAAFAWCFPAIWCALYVAFTAPAFMVIVGGIITTVILLLVVYAAIYFRFRRRNPKLKTGWFYEVAFWISVLSIVMAAVKALGIV